MVALLVAGVGKILNNAVYKEKKQVLIGVFDIAFRLIVGIFVNIHFNWKSLIGVIVVMFVENRVCIASSVRVV